MAYEYSVQEARVVYADPIKQLYRVVLSVAGTPLYAIPAGMRRVKGSTVCSSETYTVGDLVLVAVGDQAANKVASMTKAIILCLFPGDAELYIDKEDQGSAITGEPANYYDAGERAHNFTDRLGDRGFNSADRASVVSGDLHIHSKDAGVSVSELTTQIGSTDATITTNALDGSIRTNSIVAEQYTPGTEEKTQIINETVLKTTKVYGGLNGRKSENFREQTGDLPYGNVRTVLNDAGIPLSTVEQRLDGSVVVTASTGLILKRSVNLVSYDNDYSTLIAADENIDEKGSEPFIRVMPSKHWSFASTDTFKDEPAPVVRPVPKPNTELEIPDATGSKHTSTRSAESVIAQYPDGSIVLRDAWGSEIRMFNGDIQFSAANKITTIADTDILTMCGGVASLKANAGIQAFTEFGHIEAASGKEVNVTASENINIVGDQCLNMAALEDVAITTSKDILTRCDGNILLNTLGDVSIKGATYNIIAEHDFAVATQSSILRVSDSSVDVAAYSFNIHSDVEISDKQYTAGEFPAGVKVTPAQGSGGLRVGGTVTVDSGLVVGGYAMIKSSVHAAQFNAVSVADDTGVFKIKSLPKVSTATATHKSSSRFNKKAMESSHEKLEKAEPKTFLSRMFEALFTLTKDAKNALAVFLPRYVTASTSRDSIGAPVHHIASSGQAVYIYPGRDFWEGACVYAPNKDDIIDTESDKERISSITTIAKETIYYAGK